MIEFLANNWLWIAAIGFLVAMHRGGHGCGAQGGHGGHQHTDRQNTDHEHTDHQNRPAERADTDRSAT